MKKAIFKPEWYLNDEFYQYEWENLFSQVWIYAGFTARIKKPGDYFVFNVFDREIVVHRINQTIKAYLNVCPHRGGPLVMGRDGNGAPVCKYHGWAFRDAEELTGLTNLEWFNQDLSNDNCGRKLRSLKVQEVGPLMFVSFADNPISIESQYSDEILQAIEGLGSVSDVAVSIFESKINWKLNMENVKDFLHPYYVHPASFKPLLNYADAAVIKMEQRGRDLPEELLQPEVGLKELSYRNLAEYKNPQRWWRSSIKVTQPEDVFQNIYLFPNTNFFSVAGAYYVTQQYLPRGPERFDYVLSVALPEKVVAFDTSVLLTTLIQAERSVVGEDDKVLQKVQANLKSGQGSTHYSHGDYEAPLMSQMAYLKNHIYKNHGI